MNTSVSTEILQALTSYSVALDNGTANDADFVKFQRLESRITRAYQENRLDPDTYRGMKSIAKSLHAYFRIALRLDR